jgi:hypothetical protein
MDEGFHSADERRRFRRLEKGASAEERAARNAWLARRAIETGREWCCPERMSKHERIATPVEFRDLLLSMAQTVTRK